VDVRRRLAAAVTCSLVSLMACGGPAAGHGPGTTATPTTQPASPPIRSSRATVRARLLVPGSYAPAYDMLSPGTPVPAQALVQTTQVQGQEVFVDHRHGYGLAFVQSQTYPVTTADGGVTWHVDGPILYVAAADGDAYVDQISAPSARTVLVWGPTSTNVVDVTTDGGTTWWAANLGPGVLGMGDIQTVPGELWAVVADPTVRFLISTDGGRIWSPSPTVR
jgi:hypothetical protein